MIVIFYGAFSRTDSDEHHPCLSLAAFPKMLLSDRPVDGGYGRFRKKKAANVKLLPPTAPFTFPILVLHYFLNSLNIFWVVYADLLLDSAILLHTHLPHDPGEAARTRQ